MTATPGVTHVNKAHLSFDTDGLGHVGNVSQVYSDLGKITLLFIVTWLRFLTLYYADQMFGKLYVFVDMAVQVVMPLFSGNNRITRPGSRNIPGESNMTTPEVTVNTPVRYHTSTAEAINVTHGRY